MSIPAILAAATQPSAEENLRLGVWIVLIAVTVLAVLGGVWAGAFRPSSADGPLRIDRSRPVWPLLLVLVFGAMAWLGAQAVYGMVKQIQIMREHGPKARLDLSMLTAKDFALLATLPPIAGFICLLAGDLVIAPDTLKRLGFTARRLLAGLRAGVLGALVIFPCMFWLLQWIPWIYKRIGYEHPHEHDLLRVMKEAQSPVIEWALIAGAAIVAPVFEEFLFRGHLQTVVRAILVRLTTPHPTQPSVAYGFPMMMAPPAPMGTADMAQNGAPFPTMQAEPSPPSPQTSALLVEPPPEQVEVFSPPRSHLWQTWVAILGTSVLFALVHPLWMFPLIFFLSVCLGYVYERTGNLWACITIHALFNAINTALYLWQSHAT